MIVLQKLELLLFCINKENLTLFSQSDPPFL